jgi:TPR repeat protein
LDEVKMVEGGRILDDLIGGSLSSGLSTCADSSLRHIDTNIENGTCNIDGTCSLNSMEIKMSSHQWLELFAKYDILNLQSELRQVDQTQKRDGVYDYKYDGYDSNDLYELLRSSSEHFFHYLISLGLTEAAVANIHEDIRRNQYVTVRKNKRRIDRSVSGERDLDTEHILISEMLDRFLMTPSGSPSSSSCPSVFKISNNILKSSHTNSSMYLHSEHPKLGNYKNMRDADYNPCLVATNYYFPVAQLLASTIPGIIPTYSDVTETGFQVLDELILQFRAEEEIRAVSFTDRETDTKDATMNGNADNAFTAGGKGGRDDDERKAAEDYYADQYLDLSDKLKGGLNIKETKEEHYTRRVTEAAAGDMASQMWVGKSIYSSRNGHPSDATASRDWFEKAASLGSTEACYILGVFYTYGLGGVERNRDRALESYLQAAGSDPFPMSFHALGDFYHYPHSDPKALRYYLISAEYNSHESHYQLAVLYKKGIAVPMDIPQAVVHFSKAATMGNMKAIFTIAEALYDPESWLHQYSRSPMAPEIESIKKQGDYKDTFKEEMDTTEKHGDEDTYAHNNRVGSSVWFDNIDIMRSFRFFKKLFMDLLLPEVSTQSNAPLQSTSQLLLKWKYDASMPISMSLPRGFLKPLSVVLPHPLSAINRGPSTYHLDDSPHHFDERSSNLSHIDDGKGTRGRGASACGAALHLLKYLADFSQKPTDLMTSALTAFNDGDLWGALDLYDEAADMGSQIAQDNAVYLYEILIVEDCADGNHSSSSDSDTRNPDDSDQYSYDVRKKTRIKIRSKFKPRDIKSLSNRGLFKFDDSMFISSKKYLFPTRNISDQGGANRDKDICRSYLNYMANHRLIELSNGGDVYALRDLADNLMNEGSEPHSQLPSFSMPVSADIQSAMKTEMRGNMTSDSIQRRHMDNDMIDGMFYVRHVENSFEIMLTLTQCIFVTSSKLTSSSSSSSSS